MTRIRANNPGEIVFRESDTPAARAQKLELLRRWTLDHAVDFSALADHADDAAAAAGGIAVGSPYRTGSLVKVRTA